MLAYWPSLLGYAVRPGAGGHRPRVPRVVNGDGLGGEAIEVTVSLIVSWVQELMGVDVNEILGEIKLAYWAGDGRVGFWVVLLGSDVNALVEKVQGNHWKEGARTKM